MAALIAATVVALAPAGAQTPLPQTPAAFGEVLKTWGQKHKVKRAFILVRRDGRIVYRSALGGADAGAPVHLASLSKAITAACIATLIRDGKLGFDTPLAAALAKFIAATAPPRDPRLAGVTVAQLLTHRAGFASRGDDDDPASGRNLDAYLKTNTSRAPAKPALLAATLQAKLVREPGAQYVYGNAAYFVLGAIIEEASGRPYLSYCRDAVLKSLGLTGDLDPVWQVIWSYGGWRMTGEDYLALLDLFDVDDQRLGAAAKAWMLTPEGKTVSAGSSAWYGLGTLVRKAGRGVNVWHWGSWEYHPGSAREKELRTSFVAFAARMSDGTAWFVHATPRVKEGAPRLELDRGLVKAYQSVKNWE